MKKVRLFSFVLFILIIQSVKIEAQSAKSQLKGKKKSVKTAAPKTVAKVHFVMQKTTGGRDSIANPTEGMIIYNTTLNKPQRYTSNTWKKLKPNERYVGEEFAGGIVLYLDSSKAHGLIVAPTDQSAAAPWGFFQEQAGAYAKNIGDGKQNTDIITKNSTEKNIAARICSTLKLHGYSDWFLPSIEELKLMYYNFKAKALGNFSSSQYWSSSETDFNNAWIMNFGLGVFTENNTAKSYAVRAVRYF